MEIKNKSGTQGRIGWGKTAKRSKFERPEKKRIIIMPLWNNDVEIQFFVEALKNFASPEQLFYNLKSGYLAYVPKGVSGEGKTLQSRNSLIGQFTEKWSKTLLEPIAKELGLFAVK